MTRLLCIIPTISLLHAIPEPKEITSKGNPPKGMVWIKGTTYTRGTKENPNIPFNDEERPVHKVTVSGFYLDEHEVTNAQFGDFVDATGYKTQAEKGWSKIDFPKAPPEALKPGGIVFSGPPKAVKLRGQGAEWQWWRFQEGASWRHPTGPESNL
ncbi:formylglycine-generating enzyme family protein, partial [Akkermansiaceae bacterium]|nr:formylglycine-generating enzyme family protein [Akkermansiaceae bacterium]